MNEAVVRAGDRENQAMGSKQLTSNPGPDTQPFLSAILMSEVQLY